MRESEKTDGATKIARHSIGKKNACFLEALCHLNKNQRVAFLQTADEKFIVFANAFLIFSRITFRSNDLKKIDLANTKQLCVALRQNAIIGRLKESYWYSGADSYPVLSASYYRFYYCELSKEQNRENKIL